MLSDEQLELKSAFAIEGGELLTEVEQALLALEAEPTSGELVNRLFRALHTMKGSAGILGFRQLETFCHGIERLLVEVRDGRRVLTSPLVVRLFACHDHLAAMVAHLCREEVDVAEELIEHATVAATLTDWEALEQAASAPASAPSVLAAQDVRTGAGNATDSGRGDGAARVATVPTTGRSDGARAASPREQSAVRVDAAKLDQVSNLIVELVTAASVLETDVRRLGNLATSESAARVSELVKEIQQRAMVFRMVPAHTLFNRFQRVVRDLGHVGGKRIRLVLRGGDTEIDKVVAEKLHEPLLHLVRNAIDHGLEPEEARVASGKEREGVVALDAHHDAGHVIIEVRDDGRGINLDAIDRKAAALGLPKRFGNDIVNHIFEPGFSTVETATMLSGRGVGMDVVRRTVESLRGKIDITTAVGSGTTFGIRIPIMVSLIDGFMVEAADNHYILPMECVVETLEFSEEHAKQGWFRLRDELLPFIDIRALLELPQPSPRVRHTVVIAHEGIRAGLVVDSLVGHVKVVTKPLGRLYHEAEYFSGAGILGDGKIALFLDTDRLLSGLSRRAVES